MINFYSKNINIIKEKDLLLFEKLNNLVLSREKYEIVNTKTDKNTIKIRQYNLELNKLEEFFLHSKYDPGKNSEEFIKNKVNLEADEYIFYGFGLGYHIEKMLEYLKVEQKLYIIELNLDILKIALELNDLSIILSDPRVHLVTIYSPDISDVVKRITTNCEKLVIYTPSVKLIPKEYNNIRFLLEDINMKVNTSEDMIKLLHTNLEHNKKLGCPSIEKFINRFNNKPIIIVSAGPSLDKNKHMLKEVKGKAIVFAVGRALKSLLNIGISPDMFCIIDPQFELTYKQIEGYENIYIPLLFLDTANSDTISKYKGPKYIFTNQQESKTPEECIVDTGGSVATAILDMSIKFGGNPIIFIGQDLAYTDNKDHAEDAIYSNNKCTGNITRKVKGQNDMVLDTTLFLLSFKNWIENKIKKYPNIRFINATEGGAIIEGCEHMSMADVCDIL